MSVSCFCLSLYSQPRQRNTGSKTVFFSSQNVSGVHSHPKPLSVSPFYTPPLSISLSDLLFAVALLSPCPKHLRPSQSRLANTVPHLYNSSPLHHSSPHRSLSPLNWYHHSHAHWSTHMLIPTHLSDDVSPPFIFPLFALENNTFLLKGSRSTGSITQFQRRRFTRLVSTRLLTHTI